MFASSATAAPPTVWNVRGGFLAAIGWGIFGCFAAALAVLILKCAAQWNDPTFVKDLRSGQVWSIEIAIYPMIGCSTVFAAAGWVAHAIRPPLRLSSALLQVAGGSLAVWLLLGVLLNFWISLQNFTGLPAQRTKIAPPPLVHPRPFFLLVIPPLIVAALATHRRLPALLAR